MAIPDRDSRKYSRINDSKQNHPLIDRRRQRLNTAETDICALIALSLTRDSGRLPLDWCGIHIGKHVAFPRAFRKSTRVGEVIVPVNKGGERVYKFS